LVLFSLNTETPIDPKVQETIESSINQNRQLWTKIHDLIRNGEYQELMTLLSKHTVNLNNFNLSTDGDTLLHIAAQSNSEKMIGFILRSMSPSTKARMLKTKNKQQQLPVDLLTRWAPSLHSLFPLKFRQLVKAVLMLAATSKDGTPYYPQTHFYKLPKEIIFEILQFALPCYE
jgi:ankyrin repeat protein